MQACSLDQGLHVKCDDKESVLASIQEAWRRHHGHAGESADIYRHLAHLFDDTGVAVDACDGLEMLEHCRKADLPIVDILYAVETRIRNAGYRGGPLSLADYAIGGKQVYVFYDSTRFASFIDVRARVADRIMPTSLGAQESAQA